MARPSSCYPFSDRHQQGMSLIELMIGMVIGLLVVLVALGSLASTRTASRAVGDSTRLQQDASTAFRIIGHAARQAGARRLIDTSVGSGRVTFNTNYEGNHLDTSGDGRTRIVRGGNADNTQITLPDGVVYDPTSAQTRLYRDSWGSNGLSTLSDLAFYYWSRDLQPDLPNNVRPSPRELYPRQNFGTASNPAELDPYWNPRNNPATWQHMVNYTIGFNNAAQWSGNGSRGNGWITVLNMITGRPSQTPVFEASDTTMNMDSASRARVDSDEFAGFDQKDGKLTLIQPPTQTPPDPPPPPERPSLAAEFTSP